MLRLPPISQRTYSLFPSTTLFRSPSSTSLHAEQTPQGSALTPISQFRHLATMRASVVLPTPRVPVSRIAGCSRSEEHTSELQSLMRISYAVFCLKKKKKYKQTLNLTIFTQMT